MPNVKYAVHPEAGPVEIRYNYVDNLHHFFKPNAMPDNPADFLPQDCVFQGYYQLCLSAGMSPQEAATKVDNDLMLIFSSERKLYVAFKQTPLEMGVTG